MRLVHLAAAAVFGLLAVVLFWLVLLSTAEIVENASSRETIFDKVLIVGVWTLICAFALACIAQLTCAAYYSPRTRSTATWISWRASLLSVGLLLIFWLSTL